MQKRKIWNLISSVLLALLVALALLLTFSRLPIPGNYKVLTVLSGSMEPAIGTGSVVVIAPSDNYRIGDVITFGEISASKTPTTHRVNDIQLVNGNPVYITKGDANNSPDDKPVLESEINGKVLFSIPWLGYVLDFVKKPLGFALVIIVPAVLLIAEEAVKIFAEVNKNRKKSEDEKETENTSDSNEENNEENKNV